MFREPFLSQAFLVPGLHLEKPLSFPHTFQPVRINSYDSNRQLPRCSRIFSVHPRESSPPGVPVI